MGELYTHLKSGAAERKLIAISEGPLHDCKFCPCDGSGPGTTPCNACTPPLKGAYNVSISGVAGVMAWSYVNGSYSVKTDKDNPSCEFDAFKTIGVQRPDLGYPNRVTVVLEWGMRNGGDTCWGITVTTDFQDNGLPCFNPDHAAMGGGCTFIGGTNPCEPRGTYQPININVWSSGWASAGTCEPHSIFYTPTGYESCVVS